MKRMRFALVAAAAATALALAGCAGGGTGGGDAEETEEAAPTFEAGTTMAALSEAGTITVGTKFDQPLFGLVGPSGDPEGFDVEIAKIIASELGISEDNIEWVETVATGSRFSPAARRKVPGLKIRALSPPPRAGCGPRKPRTARKCASTAAGGSSRCRCRRTSAVVKASPRNSHCRSRTRGRKSPSRSPRPGT